MARVQEICPFRPLRPIAIFPFIKKKKCIRLYTPLPPVHLSACLFVLLSYSARLAAAVSVLRCGACPGLASPPRFPVPFTYRDPDNSSVARSPSSRFRASLRAANRGPGPTDLFFCASLTRWLRILPPVCAQPHSVTPSALSWNISFPFCVPILVLYATALAAILATTPRPVLTPICPIAAAVFLETASGLRLSLSSSTSLATLSFVSFAQTLRVFSSPFQFQRFCCSDVHPPAGSHPHCVAVALPAPAPALPPPNAQVVFDCQCRSLPPLGSGRSSALRFLSPLSSMLCQRLICPAMFLLRYCGASRCSNPSTTSIPPASHFCPPPRQFQNAVPELFTGLCVFRLLGGSPVDLK
jgi:hypothetical protein